MEYGYDISWQSDLVNTKESVLPVSVRNLITQTKDSKERGWDECFVEQCIVPPNI